jgi:hypothetical protein
MARWPDGQQQQAGATTNYYQTETAGAAVGKADITSSENSQAQRIHQLCCSRPSKHQLNINKIRGRVAFLIN